MHTVVAIYFLDDTVIIGHVGDSRVYPLPRRAAHPSTEDHHS